MPSFWFKKLSSKKEDNPQQQQQQQQQKQKLRLRFSSWRWRPRRLSLSFPFTFKTSVFQNLSFHILSAAEAVLLVLTLSCFFLCCGCQF